MQQTEANLLADTYEMAYGLVRYYTGNLKTADPLKEWEINGQKLNSIAWLTAHLCWSQNFLLLTATGGTPFDFAWLNHYSLGSDGSLHQAEINLKELLDTRKLIHEKAMLHIRSLSNQDLDKDNVLGFAFSGSKTIRTIIQHAIRHEGTHAGHLGWLCKINGIKAV